jgi:hypothetical protein
VVISRSLFLENHSNGMPDRLSRGYAEIRPIIGNKLILRLSQGCVSGHSNTARTVWPVLGQQS